MNWADYGILAIVVLSVLIGFLRGFTREFFGLATWVLAIGLAIVAGERLIVQLEPHISDPLVRAGVAYGALFLVGLLAGGILTALLVNRIRGSQFSSADRTLGGGLGLVRGVLLVALAVLIGGMTSLRESPWWKESTLREPAEVVADGLRVLIPASWLAPLKSEPASKAAPAKGAHVPASRPAELH